MGHPQEVLGCQPSPVDRSVEREQPVLFSNWISGVDSSRVPLPFRRLRHVCPAQSKRCQRVASPIIIAITATHHTFYATTGRFLGPRRERKKFNEVNRKQIPSFTENPLIKQHTIDISRVMSATPPGRAGLQAPHVCMLPGNGRPTACTPYLLV